MMRWRGRDTYGLLLLLGGLAGLAAGPAAALTPATLESVVSVLPVWPEPAPDAGGRRQRLEEPEASAVAVKPGGYLVTNLHVLRDARRVDVRLADGRLLPAEIVGRDPPTDLAVLKVEAALPPLPPGPAPALAAPVCAVGNQFGLGLSVTCGVVSAVHRTGTGFNPIEDFVQTDAAINPGASGGALVDGEGRLVGVVSAIFTKQTDANIGVNFATSVPLVMRVVEDLIAHGRVLRGRSGLRVAELSEAERGRLAGAVVQAVASGGAAEAAGIRPGDVVTRVGERPIRRASDVSSAFYMYRPGARAELEIRRDGGTLRITLELAP